ncbi:MAG: hypothetical protein B6242_14130 [Anaerolineaceae bacterium 4572_78]|nr:MAG: hypothetical protein B6242_14130 [Anaerolineaceae bacterium 4572_78]
MAIQNNLPLTESTFFILLSLSAKDKHGYAIMKDVEALSDKRVTLSTGTLYGALKRLLQRGWVERVEDIEAPDNDRPRKAYSMTDLGRRILNAEAARMQKLVGLVQLRPQEEST